MSQQPRLLHKIHSSAHLNTTSREGPSYIDNVLLYSEDPTGREMVDLIEKFLERVILSGGKINVAKSELIRMQVKYLGFVVGKEGILMDPKYRQALVEFPPPK